MVEKALLERLQETYLKKKLANAGKREYML